MIDDIHKSYQRYFLNEVNEAFPKRNRKSLWATNGASSSLKTATTSSKSKYLKIPKTVTKAPPKKSSQFSVRYICTHRWTNHSRSLFKPDFDPQASSRSCKLLESQRLWLCQSTSKLLAMPLSCISLGSLTALPNWNLHQNIVNGNFDRVAFKGPTVHCLWTHLSLIPKCQGFVI